ncbi:hypothetical protein [Vulcanisaeta souniana]|uniref:Uncharacterized protein n=1 Tax=Vulcanisaeta souniana JCM 11219 TaxID=1293586 RepID=A0A830EL75_9CREN|nr:hypothetical protein [Vulcanisaeta souniana]BDR92625.1 hypothetical protein Vsou_17180 [Vulcanisaeta souniana JCM 11219]GGI82439.1 hypothetical protein GCM10007112_18970 [Vulcanisaeta souniana JCM 11219]
MKYIKDRLSEGGKPKLARAWIDGENLYVAVVFEREVEPIEPGGYILVIDVNSWKNGITYAIINGGGKLSEFSKLRPNLRLIETLHSEAVRLERKYGALRGLGLHKSVEGKRLWRQVKYVKRKLHAYLKDFAQKIAHELALKAVRLKARVVIDDMLEESRRELLKEGLPDGFSQAILTSP